MVKWTRQKSSSSETSVKGTNKVGQTVSSATVIMQSQQQCLLYCMVGQLKLDTGTVYNKSMQLIQNYYNIRHGIQIVRY